MVLLIGIKAVTGQVRTLIGSKTLIPKIPKKLMFGQALLEDVLLEPLDVQKSFLSVYRMLYITQPLYVRQEMKRLGRRVANISTSDVLRAAEDGRRQASL
ncbi:hypothetical protein NQ318_005993 [Aromia moschata]|uniref:Uncharacterized protein n=1 Tax=Aromia moschata TaxID=1265417 RepID=A0AAV8XLI9_9CUCU|nr:hypothetical protein NQ318_005993 [Aromia moschata]